MIFYGINPVNEALLSDAPLTQLYAQTGKDRTNKRIAHLLRIARDRGIPVTIQENLVDLCNSRDHQGIAAEAADLPDRYLGHVFPTTKRLVLFDGIQDPHNFGACIRVCEVFGFTDILYHRGNSSGITPTSVKTSAGGVFHVSLYTSNVAKAIAWLKENGYALIVLDGTAETAIGDLELPEKYCLVIGSEGDGVRHMIRTAADHLVKIPMFGKLDSLNVSCALSAALCTLRARD